MQIQIATDVMERCIHLLSDKNLTIRLKVSVQPSPRICTAAGPRVALAVSAAQMSKGLPLSPGPRVVAKGRHQEEFICGMTALRASVSAQMPKGSQVPFVELKHHKVLDIC